MSSPLCGDWQLALLCKTRRRHFEFQVMLRLLVICTELSSYFVLYSWQHGLRHEFRIDASSSSSDADCVARCAAIMGEGVWGQRLRAAWTLWAESVWPAPFTRCERFWPERHWASLEARVRGGADRQTRRRPFARRSRLAPYSGADSQPGRPRRKCVLRRDVGLYSVRAEPRAAHEGQSFKDATGLDNS